MMSVFNVKIKVIHNNVKRLKMRITDAIRVLEKEKLSLNFFAIPQYSSANLNSGRSFKYFSRHSSRFSVKFPSDLYR